ncbi:BLUF domain-containing protein [Polaribacter dokdonensis]|uniref:AraC-type DNA-binding protein n=1 Tax=Polaribacter dokdonensis DSW-5 TaxID=1300348 RepID=A0A0N0UNG9_9FLAO|nr:BLUF domain-containing protein [Polaribacter dokdonensis]KOY51594.1 Transcription regulator, AraC family [Polaribacter dokdonensis DSW-5]SEE07799.1 AraC-type DNA-binding protein [Polaribacter dokdonensis DSW-5]
MKSFDAINSLKNITLKIDGDFIENASGGFLTFKNKHGKGNAKAFKLFSGLEVLSFNLLTSEAIYIENIFKNKNCLHFIFCIEGFLSHYSNLDKEKKNIHRLQNVIIGNNKNKSSCIVIPANTKVKFTIITVLHVNNEPRYQSQLSNLLSNLMTNVSNTENYTYFGEISNRTTPFVETIIDTNLSGLANRLLNEAAVLKTLSSQYSSRGNNIKSVENKNPLSKTDTLEIIKLSDYISQNLHETIPLKKLTSISGLNQKKIQKGFQYFFDETVNKFTTNLRILKAKEYLEETDYSISEIVYKIGLNSRSYFSKIFKEKYGLIPKDYKKFHHLSNPTFQLSYYSEAAEGTTKKDLISILEASKKNNLEYGISGCLIYYKASFYQILEGPKNEILNLIEVIKKDSRNKNLNIIFQGMKSGRIFGEWNMALIQDDFASIEANRELDIIPVEFLPMTDIKNPLANKYLWEKARNYLIVNQEVDK